MKVDLHLHTTHSDGTLTPTEIVDLCADRGLKVIAISDHDSTEGVIEATRAAQRHSDLVVIPAVELSTDVPVGEIHLLGYFINLHDQNFQVELVRLREGRIRRAEVMVKNLNKTGIDITWARVLEIANGAAVGRPHIAQALVENGYVQFPEEAFDVYLGRRSLAYVERVRLTPVEAIKMVIRNGAVPVMAHPTFFMTEDSEEEVARLKNNLRELKENGLAGMEVYYKDYSDKEIALLVDLAEELDLIPCGGSDYHAAGNPDEPEPGCAGPPISSVDKLSKIHDDHVYSS